jgi:hypothetical protein
VFNACHPSSQARHAHLACVLNSSGTPHPHIPTQNLNELSAVICCQQFFRMSQGHPENLLRTDNGRFFAAVNRLYICMGFVINIHDARQKGHGARPMRGGKRGTRICLNIFSCLKICLSFSSCLNFCLSFSSCLKICLN